MYIFVQSFFITYILSSLYLKSVKQFVILFKKPLLAVFLLFCCFLFKKQTVNKDQLTIESPGSPSSKQIKTEPPVEASSTAAALNPEPEATQANKKSANRAPSSSDKLKSVLASKKRIIHRYFDELSQAYVQSHNRDFTDFNRRGSHH